MHDIFDLRDSNAIVTGSSRGIGRSIAEAFASYGANVTVSSRRQEACHAVAAEINGRGAGRAVAIAANVGSKVDLLQLVEQSRTLIGPTDILVRNAASNPSTGR